MDTPNSILMAIALPLRLALVEVVRQPAAKGLLQSSQLASSGLSPSGQRPRVPRHPEGHRLCATRGTSGSTTCACTAATIAVCGGLPKGHQSATRPRQRCLYTLCLFSRAAAHAGRSGGRGHSCMKALALRRRPMAPDRLASRSPPWVPEYHSTHETVTNDVKCCTVRPVPQWP